MTTAFMFSAAIKNEALARQWNMCACCGRNLVNVPDHAHHVIPEHSDNDPFVQSESNCVMICDQCEERINLHANFKTGPVPPPTYFQFSHGKERKLHQKWVTLINQQWENRLVQ
jgi:hypothetical protein